MDGFGIEEVEVAGIEVDLDALDVVFVRVFSESFLGNWGFKIRTHGCFIENALTVVILVFAVLEAQYTCKLVFEPGNGEFVAFGSFGNGVVVWIMTRALIVNSEDRRSIRATVGGLGVHYFFIRKHFGKIVVDRFYGIVISIE